MITTGRKINSNLENPIDNILIDICDYIGPFLYKLNLPFITPNLFTSLSFIITLIGIYYIYKKKFKIGAILYFIGYFFDVLDGNYARKYNMTTEFGDKFDHITDIIKYMTILVVVYFIDINKQSKIIFYIISNIFLVLSFVALGCQEKNFDPNNNKPSMLTHLKKICYKKEFIDVSRYFGTGTNFVITSLLVYNLQNINNFFLN